MYKRQNKDWFKDVNVTEAHIMVMRKTLEHSLRWAYNIMNEFYMKGPQYLIARALLKTFLLYVKWKTRNIDDIIAKRFKAKLSAKTAIT